MAPLEPPRVPAVKYLANIAVMFGRLQVDQSYNTSREFVGGR